jgi:membrane protein implicated in regulation of membrane protease activity
VSLSRRTLARYTLFQIPGWILLGGALALAMRWWELPLAWAAGLFALWVLKDVVLYPLVRRAYEPDGAHPHGPVAEAGVAEAAIDGEGWVRIGPERWRARLARGAAPIEAGTSVRVVAVRGLVLDVEPTRE